MELLSPAGDFASLITAVKSGADAVYIGGKRFSARKNATNFTDEELLAAVDFCHLHQVKLYVTLNILVKQAEFYDALSYAAYLAQIGVDGIIVQDLGLMRAISNMCDTVGLNASTQMTICSKEGVDFVSRLGAKRVVLARELSEKEIKSIKEKTDTELEVFVHGALCMSWSGQCLLSSIIGARSGNRGLCAQPCRLSYTLLKDGKAVTEEKSLLCMKDLCLADEMHTLSGIADSAKIEGRMKRAEYTGMVTGVYKDALFGTATKKDITDMLSVFSRGGSCRGYFDGRSFRDMMEYENKSKITASKELVTEIKQTERLKKRPVSFSLIAEENKPIVLRATSGEFTTEVSGIVLEPAKSAAFSKERAEEQLKKLGDTPFTIDTVSIEVLGNPFVSVSALNALRRACCDGLNEQICASLRRDVQLPKMPDVVPKQTKVTPSLCIQVRTKQQWEAAEECGLLPTYAPYELYKELGKEDTVLALPSVTKEGETLLFGNAKHVLVQNIGQILPSAQKTLLGGERLNVTNKETAEVLSSFGFSRVTLSCELNLKEILQITNSTHVPTELIVYGRLPVMLMENCVIKSAYRCTKGEGHFELLDRKGERFPLICENCRNVLLNSVPLYMADKMEDLLKTNAEVFRLMFTTETKEECKNVILAYQKALLGNVPKPVFSKITRGHFYRGVE